MVRFAHLSSVGVLAAAMKSGSVALDETCADSRNSAASTQGQTLLQRDAALEHASLEAREEESASNTFCCLAAPAKSADKCSACYSHEKKTTTHWCGESASHCQRCSGTWCSSGSVPAPTSKPDPTPAPSSPTAAPTPEPEPEPAPPVVPGESSQSDGACCLASRDKRDKCGTCWPGSWAKPGKWCLASKENCLACSGAWCAGGAELEPSPPPSIPSTPSPVEVTTPLPTTGAPAPATTPRKVEAPAPPATTPTPAKQPADEWVQATWTTGYWDCCKPSCSWNGKGSVNKPTLSCDARTGNKLEDPNVPSVCDGGSAASCADNQPFIVKPSLSMGFAAIAVSGSHGLTGDTNCGQCFELKFVDRKHKDGNWGGSHPDLVGKSMVVQVTNIGYDVSGDHSFDLQIPGAGQGIFTNGCTAQFDGYSSGDFDCDNNYGGCFKKAGCSRLPAALQAGCEWRYDWYRWFAAGGQTNNPFVDFRRVRCPQHLTNISGSAPTDDGAFPELDMSIY